MKNSKGFSLVELLVTVAIVGILASVGVAAYTGFIAAAKEKQATTGLSSIYLAQEEYRSMFGSYYQSNANCGSSNNDASAINTNIFNGDNVLDTTNYTFCIEHLASNLTYQANAYLQDGTYLTITNTNLKRKYDGASWQEQW